MNSRTRRLAIALALALALALTHSVGITASQEKLSKHVSGVGVVTSVDVEARRIRIDHEEIKSFMDAMVMEYPVARPALLRGVRSGDKVRFTLLRRNGTIDRLEVSKRAR